jgi:adenine-specific DNA-methyltransferase
MTSKLKDFVIPPDDVSEDALRAVNHRSQWIDYWAADWDNKDDTFRNEWQTFREMTKDFDRTMDPEA